jgi:hypothetical protein
MPNEMPADCVAQLLSNCVHSWWAIMMEVKTTNLLSWIDFWAEFKTRYYYIQHKRSTEHGFIALK